MYYAGRPSLELARVALLSLRFSDEVQIYHKFKNLYKFEFKSENCETNFLGYI
jgi:hypothetical protein